MVAASLLAGGSKKMETPAAHRRILRLTRLFAQATRVGFALFPAIVIAYLHSFGNPSLTYVGHAFHEAAMLVAVTLSAFVSLVTWRCYRTSGEPFLHWLAQGLTGFTVVYLPHGALTRLADVNMTLFLLYGPVSRVVMVTCLFIGLLRFGAPADSAERRASVASFRTGLAAFVAIDILVAIIAIVPGGYAAWARLAAESLTIGLVLLCAAIMLRQRLSSPLMRLYLFAMVFFAQSSIAFMLARPWDHLWWFGHMVFAAGFFILSYGIVEAFHTTRAFASVYSQEEMMRRLEFANDELERLAATDALTGTASRRQFLKRAAEEVARSERSGEPLALLMMDIDHFKLVNDRYGHAAGDAVLVAYASRVRDILRAPDVLGRLGGEEFAVLLPASCVGEAAGVAERIRACMEREAVEVGGKLIPVTVSVGVAEYASDAVSVEAMMIAADRCLYAAKNGGRNRVVAAGEMPGTLQRA